MLEEVKLKLMQYLHFKVFRLSSNHSLLKLSTGFAIAAFTA
jgi:hypothetical protein